MTVAPEAGTLPPMTSSSTDFGCGPDTIKLGDLTVRRLGFGAMQLPGKDVWGEPNDPARAKAVVRRVVELGMNFIDTAWFYGPHVSNRILKEVLHPYPRDLVIATKLGGKRTPDKGWAPFNKPAELREGAETDLRELGREVLDVVHLRWMNVGVPFADCLGALVDMKREGKLRHIALSNVGVAEIEAALGTTEIVAVQNMYNIAGGGGPLAKATHAIVVAPDEVLAFCERKGIAFLPFFPLAMGGLGRDAGPLDAAAKAHGATRAQIAIAWLLAKSKVMLPIPGTSSPLHLEENWNARKIALTKDEVAQIEHDARLTEHS